jgi:hypothetical protein
MGRVRDAVSAHLVPSLVALGLVCALVAWYRLPAVARDTFWAEDGRTFVSSAATYGPAALVAPYQGYLHTVPRLVAALVAMLPVPLWAVATTAGACAVAGGLAVVVFVCARDLVPWMPARVFVAALTVLAPLAPREVLGNLANLHSLILWALFWIVLSRPRTRAGAIGLSAIAFLGAMTEIQAVFLVPLIALRPRDRNAWIVRAGLLAGIAIQLIVTVGWPRPQNTNPVVPPASIAYGYLVNGVMPLVVPQDQIGPVLAASGPALGLTVLLAVLAVAVYVIRRGGPMQRTLVLAALGGSALVYAAGVAANPNTFYDYAQFTAAQLQNAWLTRYGVVPSMMLATIPAVGAAVAARRHPGWNPLKASVLAAAAVSCVLIVAQVGPQFTRRSFGPAWQPQIAAAVQQCRTDDDTSSVALRETIGWHVAVPCRDLTAGTASDDDAGGERTGQ